MGVYLASAEPGCRHSYGSWRLAAGVPSGQEKIKMPLKDRKPTNEIVTAAVNFAIATKRLEDRREQDHSEEANEEGDDE